MNQLKKKRILLSVLMDNECFALCAAILAIIGWFLGTYFIGKIEQYVEITLLHGTEPLTHVFDIWLAGFVVEAGLIFIIMTIMLFKHGIINIAKTISIAKILQFLPVSKEEIKSLNITSYKSFETVLINLFKDIPKEISDGTFQLVESTLFETIVEYLSLDNSIICNKKGYCDPETGKIEDPKVKFAKLRSAELAKYLFKDGELFEVEVLLKRF